MTRLEVNSGETYTVSSGDTEDWEGATVDGVLDVEGTLELTDDGGGTGTATATATSTPMGSDDTIGLPLSVDLPTQTLTISMLTPGLSIFLMGLLTLLGGAVAFLRNYAAGIMLFLSVVALLMSGLLGIGLELFWASVAGTVILLIVGMIVRWMQ
jgi:hypothetical protein